MSFGTVRLIAAAWMSCGDFEPPYGLGLLFFDWPLIAIGSWIAFSAGVLLLRDAPNPSRVIVGVVLASVVCCYSVTGEVPMNEPDYYAGGSPAGATECEPDGVPTWWPWWLPSGRW
ncbi:MAG TPA: hypothetical protein VGQ58_10855 [Candidatus Limnocylindrales bacterium]|jgi:hypothetical protein|nr:hypothetical protein [Candidatus Limnocylindrales bacterium]